MKKAGPWFLRQRPGDKEKLSYRAWKWLWQQSPDLQQPTLLNRIEETDWDLLIILDAARYDILRQIADAVISKEISPASSTPEFLQAAEKRNIFSDCFYLSANPQVNRHEVGAGTVKHTSHLWDERLQTIPPAPLYNEAAELVRNGDTVVAHSVQPHYPHICKIDGDIEPVPGGFHPSETDIQLHDVIQGYLTNRNYPLSDACISYEACLRFAWSEAQSIAQSLRREGYSTVVTADHGEAFGEYGFVEHPVGVSIPPLRRVPWVEFNPNKNQPNMTGENSVNNQLQALGYK